MTTTIPPGVRSRRSRRADDAVPPESTARRGPARAAAADDVTALVDASARGGDDRERAARRGSGDAVTRPDRTPAGRAAAKTSRRAPTPDGDGAAGRRERTPGAPSRATGGTSAKTGVKTGVTEKAARANGSSRAAATGRTASAGPAAKAPVTTRRSTRPARRAARTAAPSRARAPFVLVVVGLLGGALVSLLLLNTVLAQDAFTLSELQQNNRQLNERKQALQEDIARENSPDVLHRKALGLGMKDSRRPAFIDARTGRVTEGGARPQGVPDDVVAAAAAGGVTGTPGAIAPPASGSAARPDAPPAGVATARSGTGTEGGRR